jgi:hypothetical protein
MCNAYTYDTTSLFHLYALLSNMPRPNTRSAHVWPMAMTVFEDST